MLRDLTEFKEILMGISGILGFQRDFKGYKRILKDFQGFQGISR